MPTPERVAASRQVAVAPAKLREWDVQLLKLRAGRCSRVTSWSRSRRVIARSTTKLMWPKVANRDRLSSRLPQRERRGSGEWGKLKTLRLKPGQLSEFEGIDRQIIAYLCGGTPERTSWYAHSEPSNKAACFAFSCRKSWPNSCSPLMCETGRVQLVSAEEGSLGEPLKWNGGTPWDLTLAVVFSSEEQKWTLEGTSASRRRIAGDE